MSSTYKIYALCNPITHEIRYIGYTGGSLDKRLQHHIYDARRYNFKRATWVNSLLKDGLIPEIVLLEENLSFEDAKNKEIALIEKYKTICDLTNTTTGGDGVMFGRTLSAESKQKISAALKGKPKKKESIKLSADKRRGVKRSAEMRKRISDAQKGKSRNPFTEEHRKNISLSHIGKYHMSQENKDKLRTMFKGRVLTEEWKHKIRINSANKKCVQQWTYDGKTLINTFDSMSDAARFLNIKVQAISRACRGLRKSAYGFVWRYLNK